MKPRPKGLDSPAADRVVKWMSAANTWVFRATKGRLGRTFRFGGGFRKPAPVCLLTTTGRTSGQPRTVPLIFLRDGSDIVLVASKGGSAKHPLWYTNLLADPKVEVDLGRTKERMIARTADAEEKARLWPRLVEVYADYDDYQSWTEREIPVVICEPA